MAYDSGRDRVLLVGGLTTEGPSGDTWVWDGTDWLPKSLTPRPGLRWMPALAFDTRHNQMVMFGGRSENALLAETWVWTNIVATAGNPQNTPIGQAFRSPLEVHVVDDTGH